MSPDSATLSTPQTLSLLHWQILFALTGIFLLFTQCRTWSQAKRLIAQYSKIIDRFQVSNQGGVKYRLRTDCGLLFLGLEYNGTIVVTFSLAW